MDAGILPQTRPVAPVQQQRPSVTYFLFLALLFYLINTSPAPASLGQFRSDGDEQDAKAIYRGRREGLLRREARAEGLARWLAVGASNASETVNGTSWLNSTYYPFVANGTAPSSLFLAHDDPSTNTSTANDTSPSAPLDIRPIPIPPFSPSFDPELPPVIPLAQHLFSASPSSLEEVGARVYPHNLTGFGKGSWEVRQFGWQEVGLNETWEEQYVVDETERAEQEEKNEQDVEDEQDSRNETTSRIKRRWAALSRRQTLVNNSTLLPLNGSIPEHNLTTQTRVHNRTLLRGSFPWTSTLSSSTTPPSSSSAHTVSLNLRSLQTTAVGPVVPLRDDVTDLDDGELFQLREKSSANEWKDWERQGPVVYLGGSMSFKAIGTDGEEIETSLDVEAAHFLSTGRIYGFATPSFVASHLYQVISLPLSISSPTDSSSNLTAHALGHAMLRELRRRITKNVNELEEDKRRNDLFPPSSSSGGEGEEDYETPRCIFSLFGSLAPLPAHDFPSQSLYAESYSSLFRPSGSSAPPLPPATLSALLSSHNCGLVLSLPRVEITDTQQYWAESVRFVVLLATAQAVVVTVLVRQLEKVQRRPGTVGNVAVLGVVGMVLVDAYIGVTMLTVGVVTYTRTSLPLLCAAFLCLLSSLLFGMRYIALLRDATPERTATTTATPAPATDGAEGGGEGGGEGEGEGEGGSAEAGASPAAGGRSAKEKILIGLTVFIAVFALYLIFWWGWTPLLLTFVYSYWIPQIVLNVHRGTARQSLSTEFVLGNTFARMLLPVYFWGYEGNCLQVETTPWIYLLVLYSLLQALLLLLQSHFSSPPSPSSPSFLSSRFPYISRTLCRLLPRTRTYGARGHGGARFFLSAALIRALELPEVTSWDYHPISIPPPLLADLTLSPADIESGKVEGDSESPYLEPDCPICLSPVRVVPTKADHAAGPVAVEEVRRACAITPCRHVVHTECLEQWMGVRAACPVCRRALPALR
ncbi:hypothetical protein JCM11251_001415 [Rhodosporidiobolus azoricus]